MTQTRRSVDPASLIAAAGIALLVASLLHHWREVAVLGQQAGPLGAFVLDGVLALTVVYAGYWLSTTDLRADDRWTVCWWSVAGGAVFVAVSGLTVLIRLYEGRVISEPTFLLLVAAESGGLAGFVAGYYNAIARRETERVQEVNEELQAVNETLEASNERLERFASALSHDLQEPLRMVESYLDLLERRYGDDLDEEATEFLEYAVDGAQRMQSMVDGLLEYSRVTGSDQPLEPTDVDAVLDDVLADLRLRIEETDATVTSDDLPTVHADRGQLAHVFRNLVSNAIRHSGDDPPRVHVGAERRGDEWQFSVRDEGVGIDPSRQDDIFDMFEQVDADGGDAGAAGVGLALCRDVVDRHGGDIWVESEPGDGSTFYFTIPVRDDE